MNKNIDISLAILSFLAGIIWIYFMIMLIRSFESTERSLFIAGLVLAIVQCLLVLLYINRFQKINFIQALMKYLRPICMSWCVLSALFMIFGVSSWINHHGLVGFVEPSSMSGLVDENGRFISLTPPANIRDLLLGLLLIILQVGSFIFFIRLRKRNKEISVRAGSANQNILCFILPLAFVPILNAEDTPEKPSEIDHELIIEHFQPLVAKTPVRTNDLLNGLLTGPFNTEFDSEKEYGFLSKSAGAA